MGVYLEEHRPASRQYFSPRRGGRTPTGAIVVHTAVKACETILQSTGAEGVAGFISRRSDPGSYHTVVDSDSIVRVGKYEWEMFGEGTGGNRWALHLSFACRAGQWPTLPESWWDPAILNGAKAAADMAGFVEDEYGIVVPARRISPAEYRAGRPGFVGHGELDPGRRSDPGLHFPWDPFLDNYKLFREPEVSSAAATLADLTPFSDWLILIYMRLRGSAPADEIAAWELDAIDKLFAGIDLEPTRRYIVWALRAQLAAANK